MNSNISALSIKISIPIPRFPDPPTEMIPWKNAVGLPKNLRQRKTPAVLPKSLTNLAKDSRRADVPTPLVAGKIREVVRSTRNFCSESLKHLDNWKARKDFSQLEVNRRIFFIAHYIVKMFKSRVWILDLYAFPLA
jgi:hypothetical protein